ncbi:hypothetical protein JTB14_003065 [Gonioctena quinquepunctata]|nr:hypothetical protein JTB14_003065 [Gonioctena quinquepunctata]
MDFDLIDNKLDTSSNNPLPIVTSADVEKLPIAGPSNVESIVDIKPTLMIEEPEVNDGVETTQKKERKEVIKGANEKAPKTHNKRLFTPVYIRPLPVLNNDDNERKGREKGKSKIYTDSPEMQKIMARAEVKKEKKYKCRKGCF